MFKELSRQIGFIVLVYICVCSSAEAQPGNSMLEKLESRLSAYKDAFRSGDYVKAASYMSPSLISKIGGEENFENIVHKITGSTIITLKPSLVEFSKPEGVIFHNNMFISVVKKIIPVTTRGMSNELQEASLQFNPGFPPAIFKGIDGILNISIVAYSEDDGNTWFFTGGNKAGLEIADIDPEIFQKIAIPVPTLIFGEGDDKITLVRENRQWVRKGSETKDGLADENLILTIAEQMIYPQSNVVDVDKPDDSLDTSIYFGEHLVQQTEVPGELAKPTEENIIKHKPSIDGSNSVFVTSESRVYHKSGCPELGAGNLLEFDSAKSVLEAGGIPCKHCKPKYSLKTGK